jgi:hypothetical protein
MKLPLEIEELPTPLQRPMREAEESEMWGDAIDAFEDWMDETGERPPAVLHMLAWMIYRDALEVMVDDVEALGTRAIELLDEAKLGPKAAALRREIQRAVNRDRKETERVDKLRGMPMEALDRDSLRSLAYHLGDSNEPADAALAARAWLIAANFETSDSDRRDCHARAALELAQAGNWDEAYPRLREIVDNPDQYDSWMPDFAWYRLLDKAIADGDVAMFEERWKCAVALKREDHFPFAQPSQATYLAFAVDNDLVMIAKHLVGVIEKAQSPRERKPLAELLERAKQLIAS